MKNKVLIVTTTPYMIRQFLMNDISILQDLDYQVEVATNFKSFNVIDDESLEQFRKKLKSMNITIHQVNFPRRVFSIIELLKSYKEMKKLLSNNYKLMHTHTPIASVISRLASKKFKSLKVIYTAHGFHFFKGAPIINWITFYPIEKWLSKYTDVLITINREDYEIAERNFKAKKVEYVPGIGIDIDAIKNIRVNKEEIKKSLKIPSENKILISVGELSKRKNHELVIKALKNKPNITYLICGQGNLKDYLEKIADENNVDLRLLGFRNDRIELIKISDIFVFPSLQEGLPVALMEAMACGCVCVVSKIRGNVDLISNNLFDPLDIDDCRKCVFSASNELINLEQMEKYSTNYIKSIVKDIYVKI
ncbi:glycosyltransferase [Thomasclavelia sp.]|uniref:glycosyltransferase n=1 Tax=Thomasclavelia sp. TaxID=3025757 RepID=UPI0025F23FF1|nr:glycosyltransferase [Thomasclavelia sp.]